MTKPPPSIISLTRIQFGIHGAGIVLAFFISIGLTHLYGSPCAPFGCNRLLTYIICRSIIGGLSYMVTDTIAH